MSKSKGGDMFGDSAVLDIGEMDGTTHTFSNLPDSALDQDDDLDHGGDTDQLLGSGQNPSGLKSYSFWSLEFYQQFFDIDTDDVTKRVLWSVLPRPGGSTANFFKNKIRAKPDLYGPFWICVTLVFSMAISGNVASYLQTDTSFKWHYDFHKVSIVSSAVFGYAWLTPALLFFAIWWLGSKTIETGEPSSGLTFLELVCLYGYSLAVFIPLSVLWLIQISSVQWILVLAGFGLSGSVLALSLWPDLTKKTPKFGTILIVAVVALHLLLACGFMLYFFHVPSSVIKVVDDHPAAKNGTSAIPAVPAAAVALSESKEKREEKEIEDHPEAARIGKNLEPDVIKQPEVINTEPKAAARTETVAVVTNVEKDNAAAKAEDKPEKYLTPKVEAQEATAAAVVVAGAADDLKVKET